MSTSTIETLQMKRFIPTKPLKDELPISQDFSKDTHKIGLRRRISSFSIKVQPLSSTSTSWSFNRSKSLSAIGELTGGPLRRWWDWGWGWILSRKPAFSQDIEMNGDETANFLGCHSQYNWKHLFYKIRSKVRKIVRPQRLPMTQGFRYDSFSYAQNFDDGGRGEN